MHIAGKSQMVDQDPCDTYDELKALAQRLEATGRSLESELKRYDSLGGDFAPEGSEEGIVKAWGDGEPALDASISLCTTSKRLRAAVENYLSIRTRSIDR